MSLGRHFHDIEHYRAGEAGGYKLLPLRFTVLDEGRYVVTNMAGEYRVLSRSMLDQLVNHRLPQGDGLYDDLKASHFLYDADSAVALPLTGLKYRTKLEQIAQFTGLHIFVVTLRCDYSCPYCQVSRQTDDQVAYDMSKATADKALELVFQSPNPNIKIEFQGGETLLNFELIRHIVRRAREINREACRDLQFVIATNLSFMSDEVIDFCDAEGINISTSLDGPAELHNKNRPRPGKNGHQLTTDAIRRIQARLGRHRVSALMTTTLESLERVESIIDEYVALGFREIFLRPLSPYGFAVRTGQINRYNTERWLDFFKRGVEYIISLNRAGYPMREIYSSVVLRKMLTAQEPGYVDLRSPAGIAIGGVVYNYDGDIYASDEARMSAEMGDTTFRLGNVHHDSYEEIFGNDTLLDAIEQSLGTSAPLCSDCAFLPYCGADPVYHHTTQHDVVGNKAFSGFCQKNMGVFRYIIARMESDRYVRGLFSSWAF